MSRQQRFYLGAAALLLLGLLAIYLLGHLQPYEEIRKHGPAPEVAANPYLAAEAFLRQRGVKVEHADDLRQLASLPSQGQTLLLFSDRQGMPAGQVRQLMDWTHRGGHLVLVAERLWDAEKAGSGDPLLDPLGIKQILSEDLEPPAPADAAPAPTDEAAANSANPAAPPAQADAADADESDHYPELTKLYLPDEEAPAYAGFDTRFHLNDSHNRAHAWANSGAATHMLQLFAGAGLVTVLTDAWLWENPQIDQQDNAWLLWYLTQDSQVLLVYRADRDSLPGLLLRHFPQALSALAVLLLLSLGYHGVRQGPLLAPASRDRRQLQEHLRGSADFLLRHGGQAGLLADLQQDICQQAKRRHPGFERLPIAEQWQLLARFSRLPAGSISPLMRPPAPAPLSASAFTRQVHQLQNLRNRLDRGSASATPPGAATRRPAPEKAVVPTPLARSGNTHER
ncbi:DUF4350 domain-containing protein [Pseudomonas sp. N040]|uniref:DUF4350 domain-containing protein n=1 Tax=Pseudomonas sp. N040 TaxID=2785325 RepID=UPI0018A299BB|nr:DUF4350 domain-containing protein [Pseudomonas sp. N040]MBF7729812.1 DUF4350 domain-containing protein [Pseudomonas sp. N040]MBW7013454.1 DUF4350 domain-containing protein [Pseudomonas sp. N040]